MLKRYTLREIYTLALRYKDNIFCLARVNIVHHQDNTALHLANKEIDKHYRCITKRLTFAMLNITNDTK